MQLGEAADVCSSRVVFTSPTAPTSATNQHRGEKKKENEPARKKMNGVKERGGEREGACQSQTHSEDQYADSPCTSKAAPDSKLLPAVQSGDMSIRISNSDRIDRPGAADNKESRPLVGDGEKEPFFPSLFRSSTCCKVPETSSTSWKYVKSTRADYNLMYESIRIFKLNTGSRAAC